MSLRKKCLYILNLNLSKRVNKISSKKCSLKKLNKQKEELEIRLKENEERLTAGIKSRIYDIEDELNFTQYNEQENVPRNQLDTQVKIFSLDWDNSAIPK